MGWLKAAARLNILPILVTMPTVDVLPGVVLSQPPMSWSKAVAPLNILYISRTLLVSQLLMSLLKLDAPLNILLIVVTLLVFQSPISSLNVVLFSNKELISVTSRVFQSAIGPYTFSILSLVPTAIQLSTCFRMPVDPRQPSGYISAGIAVHQKSFQVSLSEGVKKSFVVPTSSLLMVRRTELVSTARPDPLNILSIQQPDFMTQKSKCWLKTVAP